MKREKIIASLLHQFAENINKLPDETLKQVESGKLVISLTPAVGQEAGGIVEMTGGMTAVHKAVG